MSYNLIKNPNKNIERVVIEDDSVLIQLTNGLCFSFEFDDFQSLHFGRNDACEDGYITFSELQARAADPMGCNKYALTQE